MSGATSPTGWTYSEYARLPDDGNRYEVLDGEVLMTPSPGTRHQRIAAELFVRLRAYVQANQLGEMFWDLDLLFVAGQFLRPDMLFGPNAEAHRLTDRGVEGVPGLVVEIASPSSKRIDRLKKSARYADFGIPEYWVVDPDDRVVLVWAFDVGATDPRTDAEQVLWQPDPAVLPLELKLASLFVVA